MGLVNVVVHGSNELRGWEGRFEGIERGFVDEIREGGRRRRLGG